MKDNFDDWIDDGRDLTVASAKIASINAISSGTTTTPTTTAIPAAVCPDTKKAKNAWISWQCSRRDYDKYHILSSDREYTD